MLCSPIVGRCLAVLLALLGCSGTGADAECTTDECICGAAWSGTEPAGGPRGHGARATGMVSQAGGVVSLDGGLTVRVEPGTWLDFESFQPAPPGTLTITATTEATPPGYVAYSPTYEVVADASAAVTLEFQLAPFSAACAQELVLLPLSASCRYESPIHTGSPGRLDSARATTAFLSPTPTRFFAGHIAGNAACHDRWAHLGSSSSHCGACGTTCSTGTECVRGKCEAALLSLEDIVWGRIRLRHASSHVFASSAQGTIVAFRDDGSSPPHVLEQGETSWTNVDPKRIAVDESHVYWVEPLSPSVPATIERVAIDAGTPELIYQAPAPALELGIYPGLAVDDDAVYWIEGGAELSATLKRMPKSGGPADDVASLPEPGMELRTHRGYAYYIGGAGIYRVDLSSGTHALVSPLLASALALYEDYLYALGPLNGPWNCGVVVSRMRLDGSDAVAFSEVGHLGEHDPELWADASGVYPSASGHGPLQRVSHEDGSVERITSRLDGIALGNGRVFTRGSFGILSIPTNAAP